MTTYDDLGDVHIYEVVVKKIVSVASHEVEGIIWSDSAFSGSSSKSTWKFGRGEAEKGIAIEMDENTVKRIDIDISIRYGVEIPKAARQLQLAIKNAVESLTGLTVQQVIVHVREVIVGEVIKRVEPPVATPEPEVEDIASGE